MFLLLPAYSRKLLMRYDDVAVWSGLPDTQLLEMKDEILGGEAGKNAGHDAGD